MKRSRIVLVVAGAVCLAATGPAWGATKTGAPLTAPDAALYVVGTAHLDTQWRWTIRQTIDEYLPATLHDNFALFDRYPDYVFSFEGAFRYMLMQEYYPKEYARLKREVARGRWRVAGSWVDAVDTNMPSPESLFRHALYGNGFFRREFGKTSRDVFLPDCFGFGYALPSVAAHSGLLGFSSQKLTWGSAYGVPFEIGMWQGVDGSSLVAVLNPGDYGARLQGDLSVDSAIVATTARQGAKSGLYAACKYFGTGDTGGAPTDSSVAWLEKSIHGPGPVHVRSVASDQLARDVMTGLSPAQRGRLPRYAGELLMTRHGAGCYTSQAAMKRFNRKNERLADAAERASVAAHWLGGVPYPREELTGAWIRFLWHQFHDDLTGTSIPEAYVYSWNDEAIAQNEFATMLTDAVGAVARGLDTRSEGSPVVVYNPLSIARTDPVTAAVAFDRAPMAVRVFGPEGQEVPSQLEPGQGTEVRVTFLATVPAVGFAVYDIRPTKQPSGIATDLAVTDSTLENVRYRVRVNRDGDVASIFDKANGQELLASPIRLQLLEDSPKRWAAWEVDYDDMMAMPKALAAGPARLVVVESGPARVGLEIVRRANGSTLRQIVRLGAGSDRIEIENDIDWSTPATLLKAAFPLAVAADSATYDLGLGTIRRGTNTEKLYEVPAQEWADLSGADGRYGVAILNDCRYGWDKPDDHTLRLTLVRTPDVNERWKWIQDQRSMDLGRHRATVAICGHAGDWRAGRVASEANRLNQPLLAFTTAEHAGELGRSFSMVGVSTPQVAIRAVKLAEATDEIVVRLQELEGRETFAVRVGFARPVVAARELNAAEEPLGSATVQDGALVTSMGPYRPRTFAVRLAAPPVRLVPPAAAPVALPYNFAATARAGIASSTHLDAAGSIPEDLFPETLVRGGIPFRMGPRGAGQANAVACAGQTIRLPDGDHDRLYLVAAAVGGDRKAVFQVDGRAHEVWIQDDAQPIGQWDSRLVAGELREERAAITPAYVKPDPIAWLCTHRIAPDGRREAYSFAHFFRYRIDVPPGARTLVLPDDRRIRVLAITAARDDNAATAAAQALYDQPNATVVELRTDGAEFLDSTRVYLSTPNRGAVIHYTLDGSDPTAASATGDGPVTVHGSTTVKARAFLAGMDEGYVAAIGLRQLALENSVPAPGLRPGLECRYYEGTWQKVPDFATLAPERNDVVPQVGIPPHARPEHFGLVQEGVICVARDGLYTLHLWSDDGSLLWIGAGGKRIDNDGVHSKLEVKANVALRAGAHPLRIEYVQGGGDEALELWIEGPGTELRPVPAEMLFHGGGKH